MGPVSCSATVGIPGLSGSPVALRAGSEWRYGLHGGLLVDGPDLVVLRF